MNHEIRMSLHQLQKEQEAFVEDLICELERRAVTSPTSDEIDAWHTRCADATRGGSAGHYWALEVQPDYLREIVAAALEQWGAPAEPVAAEGEAGELVAWLHDHALNCRELGRNGWAAQITRSATLLQQLSAAPVPVELTAANCIIAGTPPAPFDYWPDYFNSVDKTGILSGLRISAISHAAGAAAMPIELTDKELWEVWNRHDGSIPNILRAAIAAARPAPAPAVVPIPVAERLPEPEHRDPAGYCWWFDANDGWLRLRWSDGFAWGDITHWLPAHAIPLPQTGEVKK